MQWNDTIRVSENGRGDPPGMGRAITLGEFFGLGGGVGTRHPTITTKEQPGIRLTQLTFVNFPLPVVSVTSGAGVGGKLVYQFPQGYIQRYACRALLTATAETPAAIATGAQGDLGVGSAAPADADALGTDATDDDWGTAAALTMTAWVSAAVAIAPEAAAIVDGHTTAAALYLNALIDAADIGDDTTTNLLINGDIWVLWAQQGGA